MVLEWLAEGFEGDQQGELGIAEEAGERVEPVQRVGFESVEGIGQVRGKEHQEVLFE